MGTPVVDNGIFALLIRKLDDPSPRINRVYHFGWAVNDRLQAHRIVCPPFVSNPNNTESKNSAFIRVVLSFTFD